MAISLIWVLLAGLCVALALDSMSTYLCLTRTPPGSLTEADPIASWLFARIGMVPGMLVSRLLFVVLFLGAWHFEWVADALHPQAVLSPYVLLVPLGVELYFIRSNYLLWRKYRR